MSRTMTVTHPTLQNPISALKNGGHSIRQRLFQYKDTDLAYVNCFGNEVGTLGSKKYGTITLWEIEGELAFLATKIQKTLEKFTAEKRSVWQSRRPNEMSPFQEPAYTIRCFLVGVSRSHASPHVTIVSQVEWFSNCLRDIILKGKILAAYPGWGCFRLPFEPYTMSQGCLQTSSSTNLDNLDLREYDVYIPGSIVPTHINTSKVEIWKGQSFIGHATVGGMVTVGDLDFALTVAHIFVPQLRSSPVAFEIDDSELDLIDYSDTEEDADSRCSIENSLLDVDIPQLTATVSPDDTLPITLEALIDSSSSPPDFSECKTLVGHLAYLSNIQNEDFHESATLDWALIKITNSIISKNNRSSPILCHDRIGPFNSHKSITILTTSTSLPAHLVSDALFGIPGFTSPQAVKVANIGSVQKGDSGSWAIHSNTKRPLGMLVGSCPALNESYFIGFEDLLKDIETQTGLQATITTSDRPNQLEHLQVFRLIRDQSILGLNCQTNEAGYISPPQLETYLEHNHLLKYVDLNDSYTQGGDMSIGNRTLALYFRILSFLVYIGEPNIFPWLFDQWFFTGLPAIDCSAGFPGSQQTWNMFLENQCMFTPIIFDSNRLFERKMQASITLAIFKQYQVEARSQVVSVRTYWTRNVNYVDKGSNTTTGFQTSVTAEDLRLNSDNQNPARLSYLRNRQYALHQVPTNVAHRSKDSSPTPWQDWYHISLIPKNVIETAAARAMLQETHEALATHTSDNSVYTSGSIKQHSVIISCLIQYGMQGATEISSSLVQHLLLIPWGMSALTEGVAPNMANMPLGDNVASTRMVQYKPWQTIAAGQLQRTGRQKTPRRFHDIEACILHSRRKLKVGQLRFISGADAKGCFANVLQSSQGTYFDAGANTVCYDAICSGNQVMKMGTTHDNIARRLGDALCFAMEASGLIKSSNCYIIRGICDYSDSHKIEEWQSHAAAAAATYTREQLKVLPLAEPPRRDAYALNTHQPSLCEFRKPLLDRLRFEQIDRSLQKAKIANSDTSQWFLDKSSLQEWLDPGRQTQHGRRLCIRGKPGAGKSTLINSFANMQSRSEAQYNDAIFVFFCPLYGGEGLEGTILGMYRSLLLQLLKRYPDLQVVLDDPDLGFQRQNDCPSLEILKAFSYSAAFTFGRGCFTFIADALDECDEQQAMDIDRRAKKLARLSTEKGISVRGCFCGRYCPYKFNQQGTRHILENQPGYIKDLVDDCDETLVGGG